MVKKVNVNKKTKVMVGCLFGVVTIFVLLFLIRSNSQLFNHRKQTLSNLEADLVNLDKIATDLKDKKPEVDRVLASVPRSYEEISQYAKRVEFVADQLDLVIEIKFDKAENSETNGLNSTKVNLTTSGSYQDLIDFIDNLSQLPYHFEIDSLKFIKNQNLIDLDISYRIFTYINK